MTANRSMISENGLLSMITWAKGLHCPGRDCCFEVFVEYVGVVGSDIIYERWQSMLKKKMIQHNLLKNSISAYFAAIELHNKPNFNYRYETVTLLLINAWELLLKAFIRKYIKNRSIFETENHTIPLDQAMNYAEEYINSRIERHAFAATKENLKLLEQYRNHVTHFYNESIEPIIFTLIAKNALDFVEFVKKHFNKDIIKHDGLFIMPLGFKLPFKPEDYLSKGSANYNYSPETKSFIDQVVTVIQQLNDNEIDDSIVLGFNIYLESVKKMNNSDLIVAITANEEEAQASFLQTKIIRISTDQNAAKVRLSDEELVSNFPLSHREIIRLSKERYTNCLINSQFHQIMREIEQSPVLAHIRKLNPNSKRSPVTCLYSTRVFEELDKHYTKRDIAVQHH